MNPTNPLFYFYWHFLIFPVKLFGVWSNFTVFYWHFFSVGILFKTLFSPWKRVYRIKEKPGFSPSEILDRLSFNLISRCIGFLIRTAVIFCGISAIIINLLSYILLIVVWIFIPILTYPIYYAIYINTFSHLVKTANNPRKIASAIKTSEFGSFITGKCHLSGDTVNTIILNFLVKTRPEIISGYNFAEDLFYFIYQNDPELKSYLFTEEIEEADIARCISWFKLNKSKKLAKRQFWNLENLLRIPSLGKNWTSGFTLNVDNFTTDLSQENIPFGNFIGRQKEISTIERILSKKTENNVLIIGQTGVGKHPLLIHLAHEINNGTVLPGLEGKRLLSLEMERLFKQYTDVNDYKSTLTRILDEADAAGNIILVIDEFDRYIASHPDRIDISDVIYHMLAKNHLRIIALTTPEAYFKYFQNNATINPLFETVEVKPLDKESTYEVIFSLISRFETGRIKFQYQAIRAVVDYSDRYIKDIPFPEKAISILDNVSTESIKNHRDNYLITKSDIQNIIEEKIKIPLKINDNRNRILLDLENLLHQRIIGQDEAIKSLAEALRRSAADINTKSDKPIGAFLFLGPTGVGKTETAKAMADLFFSKSGSIIRFDMSEYQDSIGIKQFIGDFQSGEIGTFIRAVTNQPYSVILLDELEKADKNLINIFLTAIDEGYITDAFGKKAYLTNSIIIATSNAGAQFIHESVNSGQSGEVLKQNIIEHILSQHIFSPEMINRFDSVIIYLPLTDTQAGQVLDLHLKNFNLKANQEHGITVNVCPETKTLILHSGFDKSFGGRAISRAVQKYIENPLSVRILKGEIKRGDIVTI